MKIAVFCASSTPYKKEYSDAAAMLGTLIARRGDSLYYGGSNLGVMGIISGAALATGGYVVGVIPTFFSDEIIYSQPVSELVKVSSMAERKEYMIHECDAFVALPGGVGTIDEILEVMIAKQLKLIDKPVVLYNPDGFYDHFISQIDEMGANGFFRSGKRPDIHIATSIEEVLLYCK